MKIVNNGKHGFDTLVHPVYADAPDDRDERLVQASSIVGRYDDALTRPGSSALWVGDLRHLNRGEVAELVGYLSRWLGTGRLKAGERNAGMGGAAVRGDEP